MSTFAVAFFARGGGALLDVQAAWHEAVNEGRRRELAALYEAYPGLVGLFIAERFEKVVSESVLKRMDRREKRAPRRAGAR